MSKFRTGFEARNLGRGNAIGGSSKRRRKKKSGGSKGDRRKGRGQKSKKQIIEQKQDGDDMPEISRSGNMKKLYSAHPRHIIKLILKKLCQSPSFYRMLGSLGIALKSSGVSLEEFFLSSSNKLPKPLRNKLRYDVNDQRVLILARLAVHKMLIREGSALKSAIHSYGTHPQDIDSDAEDPEINELPPQQQPMKKGLKYINNDKFAEKMQTENPQGLISFCFYPSSMRQKWCIFALLCFSF